MFSPHVRRSPIPSLAVLLLVEIAALPAAGQPLVVTVSHSGDFTTGTSGVYAIQVKNDGASPLEGTIVLTDLLPAGLAYSSHSPSAWVVSVAGQAVTFVRPGPLPAGGTWTLQLTVSVAGSTPPDVVNHVGVGVLGIAMASDPTKVNPGTPATPTPVLSFAPAVSFAVPGAYSFATGDVNGDGKVDVVARTGSSIKTLLGNGTGGFGVPVERLVGGSGLFSVPLLADLNGDGKLDVILGDQLNKVRVLLGNGTANFGDLRSFVAGGRFFSLYVADFTGDGKLDVAGASSATATCVVLAGDGAGNLGSPTYTALPHLAGHIAGGDWTADGKPDLVVSYPLNDRIALLSGTGTGTFGVGISVIVGDVPGPLAAADFDSDGKLDLAVLNQGASTVTVLKGNGAGTLSVSATSSVAASAKAIAVADLDDDDKLDISSACTSTLGAEDIVSILRGDGLGGVAPKTDFSFPDAIFFGATADLNGDGKHDLIIVAGGKIVVRINIGGYL